MYSREETIDFLLAQTGSANLVMSQGGAKNQTCLHLAAARAKSLVSNSGAILDEKYLNYIQFFKSSFWHAESARELLDFVLSQIKPAKNQLGRAIPS